MQNVLITGGAGYVGHVLTPRWGAGVRPIDCSRHVLPALPPEFADGPLRSCDRRSRAGGSQTSSTLIALVSGEGTFQSFVTLPLRSPDRDFGDGQLHRVAHSTRV